MTTPTSARQQQVTQHIRAEHGADASVAATSVSLGNSSSRSSSSINNHSNHPLRDVVNPHPHDVLCGRGGATNSHIGNSHWRTLVTTNKELYVTLPKRQKQLLSKSIVHAVRCQNPPGRFLQKDFSTGLWFDVGDVRACEKTSQALREGAPLLRVKLNNTDGCTDTIHEPGEPAATAAAATAGKEEVARASSSPVVPPPAAAAPSVNYEIENRLQHHPISPSGPPPPPPPPAPAQGPVAADQRTINSNHPFIADIYNPTSAAAAAIEAVPPPPSMPNPVGEFSFGTISIPDPSEVEGLENGFSFGSVMSDGGVQEEPSRCGAAASSSSCINNTMQNIEFPPPSHYQHEQRSQHAVQHSYRPVQRDSLADAGGRLIMPPTALQANELSFGSIIMTDAEQSRLETNVQKQQQQQYISSSYDSQSTLPTSDYDLFGRPTAAGSAVDEVMVQPVDGGLEPAGFSAGSMMSIGTINLENAGMSLGSMIAAVDGGLEAIGTSFGSMTIGGGHNINSSSHNPLPAVAKAPRSQPQPPLPLLPPPPAPPQPPIPMQGVPTFLRQKRSKTDLLECSDTESEDDEHSAQVSAAQKSAEWEKLKATFESQMAGGAYNDISATFPPSFNPIAASAERAQQRAAAAVKEPQQQPLVLDIPETGFVRDLSQMSACSVGDFQDEEHHHNPADGHSRIENDSGNYDGPPPPPPHGGGLTRTASEELRAFEVTLLNRGSSLAAEEFRVPKQPE